MTSERSEDMYSTLTRIVILNCCHPLLKEQISSSPWPQAGAAPRHACVISSPPPPQALEESLQFLEVETSASQFTRVDDVVLKGL
jgi:hypothetical protein